MNAMTAMRPLVPAKTVMGGRALRRSVSNGAVTVAKQLWCPGGQGKLNPTYLDGTLRACPLVVEPGLCWLVTGFMGRLPAHASCIRSVRQATALPHELMCADTAIGLS